MRVETDLLNHKGYYPKIVGDLLHSLMYKVAHPWWLQTKGYDGHGQWHHHSEWEAYVHSSSLFQDIVVYANS